MIWYFSFKSTVDKWLLLRTCIVFSTTMLFFFFLINFLVAVLLHLKTIIQLLSIVITLHKKPPVSILITVDKYVSNVFFMFWFTTWTSKACLTGPPFRHVYKSNSGYFLTFRIHFICISLFLVYLLCVNVHLVHCRAKLSFILV